MKLLLCYDCGDIVPLENRLLRCKCGHVEGMYMNSVEAWYRGNGCLLGITNTSLNDAIYLHKSDKGQHDIMCFTIPDDATTVTKRGLMGKEKKAEPVVPALEGASTEQLDAELKRRKKLRPTPLTMPDYSKLWKVVVEGMNLAFEEGCEDGDLKHYIWEAALDAVYGKAIWDFRQRLLK